MKRITFEPFGKLDITAPFKLIPLGTWYRDDRKLQITEDRLREIVDHAKSGLPNYRVPINLDHTDNQGKVGEIREIAFMPVGPKGPGLYVTDYELTEAGMKAVEAKGYDAVSAEIVWTLNGSTYQDPKTGDQHDNVLVGVALTPYPYFGHDEVALYSAKPETMDEHGYPMQSEVYRPFGGATSFVEYDAWLDSEMDVQAIKEAERTFRGLLDNIQSDPEMAPEDRASAIKALADEFGSRIKRDSEDGE